MAFLLTTFPYAQQHSNLRDLIGVYSNMHPNYYFLIAQNKLLLQK